MALSGLCKEMLTAALGGFYAGLDPAPNSTCSAHCHSQTLTRAPFVSHIHHPVTSVSNFPLLKPVLYIIPTNLSSNCWVKDTPLIWIQLSAASMLSSAAHMTSCCHAIGRQHLLSLKTALTPCGRVGYCCYSEQHSVHADVLQCQGQKSVSDRNMTELEEHYALPLQKQWWCWWGRLPLRLPLPSTYTRKSAAIYPSISPHL